MYIFDIKRYAINDGPGIRTTIFMKGCPLRCVWCHNPEGWTQNPQILYKKSKCIGCQTCVKVCPQDALALTPEGIVFKDDCTALETHCHRCTEECPTTALEICGREYTMEALMAEIEKERAIMEDSGGGVTLCGGEPLMHPEETLEILHELGRRGFHRTVDTTLYAKSDVVMQVAAACELLLVDLKLMDSEKHRLYTGVPNELILQNIRLIAQAGCHFQIRIPLIEGINADEANIEQTAQFLLQISNLNVQSLNLKVSSSKFLDESSGKAERKFQSSKFLAESSGKAERKVSSSWTSQAAKPSVKFPVNLLPYHDVGKDKHRRMWSTYNPQGFPMETPSEATIQRCREQLEAHGLHVIIGG